MRKMMLGKFVLWSCGLMPLAALALGDGPVLQRHVDQAAAESGTESFDALFAQGHNLFVAKFNQYDGQGRPATTGGGAPRVAGSAPLFLRTSGPDSNSCAGCHNDPFVGGAGDVVANVFVLAQTLDPVTESVSGRFSNERNTLGMQGSGAIEMLAREMSVDLRNQRAAGMQQARASGQPVRVNLSTNGVAFGALVAHPDGHYDNTEVQGIDADLVLRPFHQKGVVVSLREFSVNAMNHHHGMQAVERFGMARTGSADFDQDDVADELSVGDITAVTLYQAALGVPGQVLPSDTEALVSTLVGERIFERVGCADCHVPLLALQGREFVEPNPFNPSGTAGVAELRDIRFDLTTQGQLPRLEPAADGGALVRAYTDLKRHNLCDADIRHLCNEQLVQAGVATELFLTRKLWDVGNSAPYGHKGDLTTLTEAIDVHGGEARYSRNAYFALDQRGRDAVIDFMKSLQMLPPGTPELIVDSQMRGVQKVALQQRHKLAVQRSLAQSLSIATSERALNGKGRH